MITLESPSDKQFADAVEQSAIRHVPEGWLISAWETIVRWDMGQLSHHTNPGSIHIHWHRSAGGAIVVSMFTAY